MYLFGRWISFGDYKKTMPSGVEQLSPSLPALKLESGAVTIPELPEEMVLAVQDFSMKLLHTAVEKCAAEGTSNMILSPASVYSILLVTASASEEGGQDGYEEILGIPAQDWQKYGSQWMEYMNQYRQRLLLQCANSVWIDTGIQVEDTYIQEMYENLYTEVFQSELESDVTRKAVNQWVSERTHGLISEMRSDNYPSTTLAAFINAFYLKMEWEEPFLPGDTQERIFTTEEHKEIVTSFLCDERCHRKYFRTKEMEAVLLPYVSGDFVFAAVRPANGQTAKDLLLDLTKEDWNQILQEASGTYMNFSMPKFTLEYKTDLTKVLQQMGMESYFGSEAEYMLSRLGTSVSGIPVTLDGIGQTVKILVEESGTEAAAVTEVTAAGTAMEEEAPLEVHFDSPYVYAILDRKTEIPLFVGLMEYPEGTVVSDQAAE